MVSPYQHLSSLRTFAAALFYGLVASAACAGTLQQAEVNRIVHDVRIMAPRERSERQARLNDVIKEDLAVRTGVDSRAELLFQDNTLTRLGAESLFSFKPGTRDMTLDRGTMLLQVPKGLGGARIQTAAVTAAITGTTIMMENIPGSHVKVLVLEGSLRLSVNGRLGESVILTPGKMVIIGAKETRMPKPVPVDLQKLVKTSALVDPARFRGDSSQPAEPLPSMGLIQKEIALQAGAKAKAQLAETNLIIQGDGTQVQMASRKTMAALDSSATEARDEPVLLTFDDRRKQSAPAPSSRVVDRQRAAPGEDSQGETHHPVARPIPDDDGSTGGTGTGSTGGSTGGTGTGGTTGGTGSGTGTGTGGSTTGGSTGGTSTGGTGTGGSTTGGTGTGGTGTGSTGTGGTSSGGTSTPPDPIAGSVSAPPAVTITAPPAVDSSAWVFATAPYPWPNLSALIPINGTAPLHPLPPANPSYTLHTGATAYTGGAVPRWVEAGTTYNGTIYGGAAQDGLATAFLFGSTVAFDAQLGINGRFGTNYGTPLAPAGVAVYKFSSFAFDGTPTFDTANGPLDVAIIGQSGVSSTGQVSNLDVSNLHSLSILSENATISLSSKVNFQAAAGSAFEFLHLYGRGTGTGSNVTLGGAYQLPSAKLFIDATNNAVISRMGNVNAGTAVINAMNAVQIPGSLTADFAQLWAKAQITVNGTVNAKTLYTQSATFSVGGSGTISGQDLSFETSGDFAAGAIGTSITASNDLDLKVGGILSLNTTSTAVTRFVLSNTKVLRVEAGTLNVPQSITLAGNVSGTLKAGAGGLNAAGFDLTGFTQIVLNGGNATVRNLDTKLLSSNTSGGTVTVSGSLSVDNAAVAGALNVTGTISPRVGDPVTTLRVLDAGSIKAAGLNFAGANSGLLLSAPGAGYQLALVSPGTVNLDATGINGANFNGGDAALTSLAEGGDGGTFHIGTDAKPIGGDVNLNSAITATTGANATALTTGGKGGTVSIIANGAVNVNSTVKVSDSAAGRASKQGGSIRIESRRTSGMAINVTNSGQLLSLLSAAAPGPGGKVEFVTAGGDININGSTVQADKGTVNIVNAGGGNITLANAVLRGDVVKAGVVGASGQLIIGGGSIDANSAIKLYASGSNGTVRFNDNVTLNGNSVKTIAGNTVTIDNGKTVTVNGSSAANVYTNHPNYSGSGGNGSTSGSFGGKGAVTQPFGNSPAY